MANEALPGARITSPQSVCAVIITYHPTPKMIENLRNVLAQVENLIVVDNGSSAEELDPVRFASQTLGFHLIENRENLGVAEALNQGVRWAKGKGYPWVILFDQDSGLTDGFVRQMFATWERHPEPERVASIHPRYVDPETGIEMVVPRDSQGGPLLPMTSGALMPHWIFDRIGWFPAEYFIDFIDWEYCFRIRAAGYLVVNSEQATLLHVPGDPATKNVLGHTFHLSNHNATRRYYISRNCIIFYSKYFRSFPGWVLSNIYGQLKDTIVCLIAEEDRARKFRNILLGTWDGLTGRMGKREGV
jgi:rhamnosyltransferase